MKKKHMLITGGAGFIGTNSADYFASRGWTVTVLDDFSRAGSRDNLAWLTKKWGKKITSVRADVSRNAPAVRNAVREQDAVLHLAGQVAVTTSVADPVRDFDVNARGTLNILEAVRAAPKKPALIYASTNKVYGEMTDLGIRRTKDGWRYRKGIIGISERQPLDFHSPYGCSKGAADQYVRDYSRIYGLKTAVFRQSCIFGPHQFGIEDQGWVAWFAIAAILGRPITVYGDGYQVRDVLDVSDLCMLYDMAFARMDRVSGKAYNIGGGPSAAVSVRAALARLAAIVGKPVPHAFGNWRPGDQKVYISDIRAIQKDLGWRPAVSFEKGLERLVAWIREEETRIRKAI